MLLWSHRRIQDNPQSIEIRNMIYILPPSLKETVLTEPYLPPPTPLPNASTETCGHLTVVILP